ncbi:hypothetical protein AKJ66_01570 [candidate division MSBL1 archaeon SCGC-AAA259E22]|uniref:Uncharacterized protein n=1 Tax=candidate division MSBL1 archaeon SCGC-AAA259E22 TaxID=1698265 RepID=A0A133UHJ7_9EURY|nr:hypothetical protein AKJ66_01570 [candidate division MSBL1 archaeon SCGC-AAA259E22]
MDVDMAGGSKIFEEEIPDEAENGIFEEEEIPEERLEEADEFVEKGGVISKLLDIYQDVHIGDYERKVLLQCSAFSKPLTGKSIHDHAVGSSGKGKSHLFRIIAGGIPNENVLVRDSISPKYLYYLTRDYGSDCLDGVVVYYDDVTLNEEKEAVIKTLTDPGPTDRATHGTVMDQEKIDLLIDGLPIVWVSSVDTFSSEQMRNRFFIDYPNESEELDEQVADKQKEYGRKGILEPEAEEVDYGLAKAIYRSVVDKAKGYEVKIPYDYEWGYVSDRRLQPLFLKLLHTITRVNFANRIEVDGNILSTFEDFYLAKLVMNAFLETTAENMTKKMKSVWEALPKEKDEAKTRSEISERCGESYGTVRYNLHEPGKLLDMGFANSEKKENQWVYWKTEKDVVSSCVSLTQSCETFEGLKEDFMDIVGVVVEGGESQKINAFDLWEEYKDKCLIFRELVATTTRLNIAPEDLFSLIDIDKGCETLTQLITTAEEELEYSQDRLLKELYEFYRKEFGGYSHPTLEEFVTESQDRFPYENWERLKEASKKIEQDHMDVIFMADLDDDFSEDEDESEDTIIIEDLDEEADSG